MIDGRLRGAIIFVIGAAVGGSTATFFTHKWAKKKYIAIAKSEVDSLKEYIEKLRAERICEMSGYSGKGSGNGSDADAVEDAAGPDGYRKEKGESQARNSGYKGREDPNYIPYSQYSKHGNGDSWRSEAGKKSKVDEIYDQLAAELEHPSEDDEGGLDAEDAYYRSVEIRKIDSAEELSERANSDDSGPVIISFQECGLNPEYDKEDLFFYKEDGVVTNDNEEICAAPEEMIGNCIHDSGFDRNDQEILYVRNDRRLTYYAIEKYEYAYSEKDGY